MFASRAVLLQRKVPPEERWEQIPAVAVEHQAARSPLLLLPPNQRDSPPNAVSSGGLPPSPYTPPPQPPPCCLSLAADAWRWLCCLGRALQAAPSTRETVGSMCGGCPGEQGRQAGEDRVSLLLLWLLGMFLSRNNSVPRHPVLVFSSVRAIKISGPGRCEMNFGGVLKPCR